MTVSDTTLTGLVIAAAVTAVSGLVAVWLARRIAAAVRNATDHLERLAKLPAAVDVLSDEVRRTRREIVDVGARMTRIEEGLNSRVAAVEQALLLLGRDYQGRGRHDPDN